MNPGDITEVLLKWGNRDDAMEQLFPAVYSELHKIAASLMRRERSNHTLQPTVLIHEAYMRMVRQEEASWKDRAHFFGIAAHIMRQILVEYARRKSALKRGGDVKKALAEDIAVGPGNLEVILDLDEALTKMADWDPRKLEVIELHYFGGLKAEEISEALNLSLPTVRRDLLLGRAWLREQFAETA